MDYSFSEEEKAQLAIIEAQARATAIRTFRLAAYANESDPLYFKAQRGEATMQEWLDKINEIKQRFPYDDQGTP